MPKLKLTDTDRVILAAAGARESGLVLPLPKSLKLKTADREPVLRRLLDKGMLIERPLGSGEQPWIRPEGHGSRTLIISPTGLEAIGIGSVEESAVDETAGRAPRRSKVTGGRASSPKSAAVKSEGSTSRVSGREGRTTKLDTLVAALRQRKGATINELMDATGWQAHSVRGAISGALKKRMSLDVTSEKVDGRGRVYRIQAAATK